MSSSDFDLSDDECGDIVPKNIREAAKLVSLNLMPEKSKRLYTATYNAFKTWRKSKGSNSFCEDVLLVHFSELSKKYSPPSLWSMFSMLKCTINTFDKIDISTYNRLIASIKKVNSGYVAKKSAVFTKENICDFLLNAPDDIYLCEKVCYNVTIICLHI